MVRDHRVWSIRKVRLQSCTLGVLLFPTYDGSFRWGSISVTPALSLPLFREDGVIWLIGNLEKTNRCDGLCPSLLSSLGATPTSEGMRRGVGCKRAGPGEAAMVQITVKGVQYGTVYLLRDTSYIFDTASTHRLSCLFLNWLINQAGKKSVIFWGPFNTLIEVGNQGRTWITSSYLLWPCVFRFAEGKGLGKLPCYQLVCSLLTCDI